MSRIKNGPRMRGNVPVGVAVVVTVIVVIGFAYAKAPAVFDNPIFAAAATAVISSGVGYLVDRVLRSRTRFYWRFGL